MKQTVSRLQIHCSVIITALICTGNRKDRPVACCSHATCSLPFEKLFSQRRPPVYGDELLTDKEVSHLLKVSRRTLQDYRSNGILPYIQVGGKILYRASDIERTLMDGYREAYRSRK